MSFNVLNVVFHCVKWIIERKSSLVCDLPILPGLMYDLENIPILKTNYDRRLVGPWMFELRSEMGEILEQRFFLIS